MIIVLKVDISEQQRQSLKEFLQQKNLQVHEIAGTRQSVLGAIGHPSVSPEELAALPGVQEVIPISKPYKRASREFQKADSIYHISTAEGQGIYIGGQRLVLSVDLSDCLIETSVRALEPLKNAGVSLLSYTPKRLDGHYVYDPKGLEETRRRELHSILQIQQRAALPLLCTVPGLSMLEELVEPANILQVEGSQMRNMELLAALARCGKPLILQRAADAMLEELLLTAEFLLNNGLKELILAENYMPNPAQPQNLMLDFANIQLLQELSHLPVFVNLKPPSQSTLWEKGPLAQLREGKQALVAGAQGIEFTLNPSAESSNMYGPQEAIYMLEQLGEMAGLLQREIAYLPLKKTAVPQIGSAASLQTLKVAFQGESGAYSEQALRQFFLSEQTPFQSVESCPCPDFRHMFEAVQKAEVHFAVVPLENSLAGSIMENYDLLLEYADLWISAETRLRVSHMLIGSKEAQIQDIEMVRSHPQALAQSSRFLEKHGLRPIPNFDTAGSVRELKENPQSHVGAIASALAAEIYDMKILAKAIESNPHNYTRFAIVTRRDSELLPEISNNREGNKWSLCLRLHDSSGSLAAALQIFEKYQLNLTKLESRPIMGQPWSYRFYLDSLIEIDAQREGEFFAELKKISEEYRVIGRYCQNLN